jgi:DNA polymerase III subunit delta'
MFESILGHHRQLKVLEADIATDRMSQAYLFVGPEEVGKSTVAFSFISQVLEGHDYGLGESGSEIDRDIRAGGGKRLFMYRDDGESLKVEDVRKLVDRLHLKPVDGMMFCVIENVERMTHASANAFLNILEEPPDGVIFLLLSVHVQMVLPTILSRVRNLRFSDVGEDVLKQYLKKKGLHRAEISNILRLSGGKVGLVIKLMENPELLERYTILYERLVVLLEKGDLVDRFAFAEEISKQEEDKRLMSDVLRLLALYLRGDGVVRHATGLGLISEVKHLLLTTNINKRMLLEHLLLDLDIN